MASDIPRLLLVALLAGVPALRADNAPPSPTSNEGKPAKADRGERNERKPRPDDADAEQRENVEHMRRLLAMSDAQIGRMRGVLDALEKIPAERRAELRKRLDALRRATPAEREVFLKELREKYGIFEERKPRENGRPRDGGVRNLLDKHFASFPTPEAADAERKRFLAMSREEKFAYIGKLREKYGAPEEARGERKPAPAPPPGGRSAAVAPKPPAGDPFGA